MAVHQNTGAQQAQLQSYVSGAYTGQPLTPKKKNNSVYIAQGGTLSKNLNPTYSTPTTNTVSRAVDDTPEIDEDYEGGSGGRGRGGSGGGGGESYFEGGGGGDYASMIAEMLAQQRAAAENAYNQSRSRLDSAYNDTYAALKNNLNSAMDTMRKNYEYGQSIQNEDAAKSLREAYINYMMNRRNLNQNLSAAGISGGATESSLANMYNNYGNSRNDINTTLARNLAQLLNTYENNIASANQAYNSQWADARQNYASNLNQLEQMLAGNLMSNYSGSSLSSLANFASTLADLTGNMRAATEVFTPTNNTLGIDVYNTTQGNNMGSVTDYAKYLAMLDQMAG